MSVKLTKEQLNELKEDFKDFDKDGNGTISAEEFRSFIKKHNEDMTDIEIDMALIMMDASDGDEKVNFEEFLSVQTKSLSSIERNLNDDQLTRIFKLFDSSGDGYISTREMQKISKAFGEEASLDEAEEMVEMADADCDGKVSFDEFKALMKEGDAGDEMKVTLSEEDVAEIKEMFKEIDVDGSGSITSEELQKVLKEQGAKLHESVTHVMVAMADTDGDGQINFEEFVQMTIAGPPDDLTDDQMFKIFDKNGDGFISNDELRKLMITFGEDLSDAKVNELIKEADTNGDGRVTFEEFKAAMESTW